MKEADIRPKNLHDGILEISRGDVERLILPNKKGLEKIPCPGCGSWRASFQFQKFGMDYVLCQDCYSLYLSPRPKDSFLQQCYPKMKSVQYWESHFYRETAPQRRRRIYAPRARKVTKLFRQYGNAESKTLIDVGCGYGIFLEEVEKLSFFNKLIGIEPSPSLAAVCQKRGFHVVQKSVSDLASSDIPEPASIITCFEVLEHVNSPPEFLTSLSRLLEPGGLLVLTAPSVSGLDVQLLWEKSKTVYPPHHINLLSVEGVRKLVERAGTLQLVDISTPGLLDVNIIQNAKNEGYDLTLGRFFDYIFSREDEKLLADLQRFCQKHNLSSHLMAVLRKM